MPPSRTSSLAIIVHKRSQFYEISISQKSERDTGWGISIKYLTSLCLRLCIGVRLREKAGPAVSYHITRATPLVLTKFLARKLYDLQGIWVSTVLFGVYKRGVGILFHQRATPPTCNAAIQKSVQQLATSRTSEQLDTHRLCARL